MSDRIIPHPANKQSIAQRKPVCGVGINDADYVTQPTINGKRQCCPYYAVWVSMIKRCYSNKCQEKQPTYIGCTVADEWLIFSNFRSWMVEHDWEGNALDKDLINPGNKIYSTESCCFVASSINNLLTDHGVSRGKYPQGVSLRKDNNKFGSNISINGKRRHLGLFGTPKEASEAYRKAKSEHIIEIAQEQTDPRVRKGLIRHAELIN